MNEIVHVNHLAQSNAPARLSAITIVTGMVSSTVGDEWVWFPSLAPLACLANKSHISFLNI